MKTIVFITTLLVLFYGCDSLGSSSGNDDSIVSSIDTVHVIAINDSDLETVYMNAAWQNKGEWKSTELIEVTIGSDTPSFIVIEGITVGEEITFQSFDGNKELLLADSTCATGLLYTGHSDIDWSFLCEYPTKFGLIGRSGTYYPWIGYHFSFGCKVPAS